MKFVTSLFLLPVLAMSLQAQSVIRGDIKLNYLKPDESGRLFLNNAFKKEFGNVVKVSTRWYAGVFFDQEVVSANIEVRNTGTRPMFFHYYVAFFDKNNNVVGVAGQGSGKSGLKPGGQTFMGSCQIALPKDKYKEIASYQAVIYETEMTGKME